MDEKESEATTKKLLIFNGKPENYLVWSERFQSYLNTKKIRITNIGLQGEAIATNDSRLYHQIIMHLDDSTAQAVIALDNKKGTEVWEFLKKTFGSIKTPQILALWKQFLDLKKESGESMTAFLNNVDVLIYKLTSAEEHISDTLKIASVLKALPTEYDSFIAAVQFQTLNYADLKSKLVEKCSSLKAWPRRDGL